jgi:hypothetical protein
MIPRAQDIPDARSPQGQAAVAQEREGQMRNALDPLDATLGRRDVVPDQNGKTWTWRTSPHYPGRQIRFHGVPSVRFAAQVGADAPVAWRQGEAWPVKIVSLNELIEGDAPVTETPTGRRPVLGDTIITMDSGRSITVSIPAGHTVTVHTRG